jgi:hypothetical protein
MKALGFCCLAAGELLLELLMGGLWSVYLLVYWTLPVLDWMLPNFLDYV